jgi:hypothetical protein
MFKKVARRRSLTTKVAACDVVVLVLNSQRVRAFLSNTSLPP